MNLFFQKVTPVSIACIAGIVYLIYGAVSSIQENAEPGDHAALGFILVFIFVLVIIFSVDRVLAAKIAYRKLFIYETLFLAVGIFGYLFFNRTYEVRVETSKPYFLVIHDSRGIKKEEMSSKKFFDRYIQLNGDSIIHLNNDLDGIVVKPPDSWGEKFIRERKEAVIHPENTVVEIYAKGMDYKEVIGLLNEEVKNLENR